MRMHFIKILPGDKVTVELSPYDLKRPYYYRLNEIIKAKLAAVAGLIAFAMRRMNYEVNLQ